MSTPVTTCWLRVQNLSCVFRDFFHMLDTDTKSKLKNPCYIIESWTRGASIGWHSDDNRPYLKQRDFAAVCYLNSYGEDFQGGLFHFQDSEPTTILPLIGDVLMYTADGRNIHCVDEITDGERLTLTLWFSRNGSHDEDAKLISLLSQSHRLLSYKPLPASTNMYWFPPDQASSYQSGFDIRYARMHVLGFDLYSAQHESCLSALHSSDFSEILIERVQLIRGDELFDEEFGNILHVLQVVQFYCWKASELQTGEKEMKTNVVIPLSQSQREEAKGLKRLLLKDEQLAETIFRGVACDVLRQHSFDGVSFSAALTSWDSYSCELHKELLKSLPHWNSHQSIFSVSSVSSEIET